MKNPDYKFAVEIQSKEFQEAITEVYSRELWYHTGNKPSLGAVGNVAYGSTIFETEEEAIAYAKEQEKYDDGRKCFISLRWKRNQSPTLSIVE